MDEEIEKRQNAKIEENNQHKGRGKSKPEGMAAGSHLSSKMHWVLEEHKGHC